MGFVLALMRDLERAASRAFFCTIISPRHALHAQLQRFDVTIYRIITPQMLLA